MSALHERLVAAVGGMEVFARNWSWRSHSPNERAREAVRSADESIGHGLVSLRTKGATEVQVEEWTAKAIRLWLAYQASGARTANPMITGPARFPVDRNRKAMESERKRGEEYYSFINGVKGWMDRQVRSAERAALSAKAAETQHRTLHFPGVKLVQNATLDRIQLVFDSKPDAETIAMLKSAAFRWSPREAAWQRQNTNNGVQAAYRLLRALGHNKADTSKVAA